MWVDSHCHLNHANIAEIGDPDAIIADAKANGTDAMLTICCRMSEEAELLQAIAARNDNVWCTLGTHPHDAAKDAEKAISEEQIIQQVQANDKVIGIGETGLDYYYDFASKADQKASFEKQLNACIACDVPVIIHARDADDDVADILENASRNSGGKLKGIMHCFSSGEMLAKRALDIGFYVSFSGILTFKKSEDLRDIARQVPLDRLLVETDAPFLAPMPYRGKVNRPAWVGHVGACLAEIHQRTEEEMANITRDNFYSIFSL